MKTPVDISQSLREETLDNLQHNILPFWMARMRRPEGGFYGRIDGHGNLHTDAPRGAVMTARILWTFSAAYRVLGNAEYLEMATEAKRELIDRFYDPEYGGAYWSIDAAGNPLDTKKQIYALGFAIYGLTEYSRATGDKEALDYALKLFKDIETHSRDHEKGGYREAATRTWQPIADMRLSVKDSNDSKTMNTHLHIIEPYANLLRVHDTSEVREAVGNLIDIFLDKIKSGGHMGLFFDDDWHRTDGIISYGHDIEASWLLLEAAQVLGDEERLKRVLPACEEIALAAFEGRNADGSLIYERHADGAFDKDLHWWVQAENVIGQLYLYKYHDLPEMLGKAWETWRFIADNLVDVAGGEWWWSLREGVRNLDDDKAGFWKCPYHNSRMCLEIYERLQKA